MTGADEKTKKIPDQTLIETEKLGSVGGIVVSDIVSFYSFLIVSFKAVCLGGNRCESMYVTVMYLLVKTLHYFILQ